MKKLLLSLGVVALVLIGLLIALVIFLPKLVDTQTFRNQLTEQVRELTGQELSVDGDLSISVFPWLGIRTGEIRLSQPPSVGLDQAPLLSVQRADVGVKFLPLLQKKIEISEIVFASPNINYIETKNGSTSLDGFSQNEQAQEKPQVQQTNESASSGFAPAAIVIAGVSITDGQLTIDNQATGERHSIQNLQLSMGNLLGGGQEPVSFLADVTLHEQPLIAVALESKAQLALEAQTLTLSDTELSVEQNNAKAEFILDNLEASAETITINKLKGNINTAELLAATLEPELSITRIHYDLLNQQTNNIAFSLLEKTLGLNATGDIEINMAQEVPLYKGQLVIDELVPLNIMALFGVDYQAANDKVLKAFALSTQFNGSDKGLTINQLAAQLDQTTLSGNLAILNFEKPRYNFLLNLDRINLDDYMPPQTEQTETTASVESEPLALLLPVEIFKNIYANGNFTAELIQASGIKLQDLDLAVASTETTVSIQPSATLYEGSIGGSIDYKALSAQRSLVTIAPTLSNVQFGGLLADADITDQISGRGALDINIEVTDNNGEQTNQGTIGFLIKDGALKNIDIQKSLYEAQDRIDRLKGKTPKERPATRSETRFAEASGTFTLDNFVLNNNDLLVKAPAFRVNGEGIVNIENQSMDYLAKVAIVETDEGQGGKELSDLKGLIVPLSIKGTFAEPKPSVDVKRLLEANTKKDVDQEVDSKKQVINEKLEEKKQAVEEKKEELLEDAKKKLLNKFLN